MDEKELKVKLILALLQLKQYSDNDLVMPRGHEASYSIKETLELLGYQNHPTF